MAQRSKQVENRVQNGEAVVASGRTHRDLIAARVAERVDVLSKAEIAKLIDAVCQRLEAANGVLGAAEDRYVAEQADDVTLRDARDHAATVVGGVLGRIRNRVGDALGETGLRRYALDASMPRTPSQLATRSETVIQLLRGAPAELDDGVSPAVSTTRLAKSLVDALEPLSAALATLVAEARENEAALTARDRVVEDWTLVYQGVATTLAGLYVLAAREDLAERIRPTQRRAAGQETADPDPGPSEPVPPAPPTDAGA